MWTIGVVIGSTRAGGGKAWSAEGADGADGGGAKRGAGGSCRGVGGVTDTGRGGKRKPVTEGARTGDTDMGGVADGERSEDVRHERGDAAGGGEPCVCRDVVGGHGVED